MLILVLIFMFFSISFYYLLFVLKLVCDYYLDLVLCELQFSLDKPPLGMILGIFQRKKKHGFAFCSFESNYNAHVEKESAL